jgi:hypothetical protein
VGGVFGMDERGEKVYKIFVGNPEEKITLRRPIRR